MAVHNYALCRFNVHTTLFEHRVPTGLIYMETKDNLINFDTSQSRYPLTLNETFMGNGLSLYLDYLSISN